jgi:hypothetical protein
MSTILLNRTHASCDSLIACFKMQLLVQKAMIACTGMDKYCDNRFLGHGSKV